MPAYITNQPISVDTTPDTLTITPELSIGIDDVRSIQKFCSRKPNQNNRTKVIVNQAHLMTVPAQNAALKILEEPPEYVDIYLITNQPDLLIPTVLSRCIQISGENSPRVQLIQSQLISKILESKSLGDKISIIDEEKFTRETLKEFIEQLEVYFHNHLQGLDVNKVDNIYIAKKYVQANCSVRLITTFLGSFL